MAAYQATLQAYYAYRKTGYEHRLGVFAWQSLSTKVIFVVVLLLVLAGIYFAAIQFHAACAGATASTRRPRRRPSSACRSAKSRCAHRYSA
jgi:heme/copper-type cytochrome/quinol oxidase subunit 1